MDFRNSKFEIRMTNIQKGKSQMLWLRSTQGLEPSGFDHLNLFRISNFVLRISGQAV